MSLNQDERILETIDQQEMVGVCGRNEEFLRIIRDAFECKIVARGNQIAISVSHRCFCCHGDRCVSPWVHLRKVCLPR